MIDASHACDGLGSPLPAATARRATASLNDASRGLDEPCARASFSRRAISFRNEDQVSNYPTEVAGESRSAKAGWVSRISGSSTRAPYSVGSQRS